MSNFFDTFFGNKMPPHGHCYLWDDRLVSLHVITDAIIVLAYFTIPLALVYLVRRRDDLSFNYMFVMFAIFIFACGTTHLVNIYNVWYGAYWLSGSIKAITAVASIGTAVLVWPLIPKALAIPSNRVLQGLNEQLAGEAARNAQQAKELETLSNQLEIQVQERTAELENAKRLLVANNRALEASNRELNEYANITAHDLREPLKKIRAQARLLSSKLRPEHEAELKSNALDIADTSERMSELIDSLLSYARVESVTVPAEDTDVNSVAEEVLRDLAIQIRKREVSVIKNVLPELPVERYHLHQILLNLLSNALKYTAEGRAPVIEIGPLRPADRNLVGFHVRDNGIGIAEADRERIFRFAEGRDGEGRGIGLAICKKIIEKYGGTIDVDSREGEGANFRVYFPQRPSMA